MSFSLNKRQFKDPQMQGIARLAQNVEHQTKAPEVPTSILKFCCWSFCFHEVKSRMSIIPICENLNIIFYSSLGGVRSITGWFNHL